MPSSTRSTRPSLRSDSADPRRIKTKIQADTDAKTADDSKALPTPVIQRSGAPKRLPGLPRAGFRSTLRRIMRDQGLPGFYRGFAASMLNSGSMTFAYFYWYTVVRRWYMNRLVPSLPGTASSPVRALGTVCVARRYRSLG